MVEKVTIFSNFGEEATLDAIDAKRALQLHPEEWSTKPFSADEIKKGKAEKVSKDKIAARIRAEEQGKAAPVEEVKPLTASERSELDRLRKEAEDARSKGGPAAPLEPIDEAAMRAELNKSNATELADLAKAENIAVEADDDKKTLVTKIIAGRKAIAAQV